MQTELSADRIKHRQNQVQTESNIDRIKERNNKQTAREMAIGAVFEANADISLSVTGIAGPDGGTEEIPVGLVFIACCLNDKVTVKEYHFEGDRAAVRAQAVESALRLLKKTMAESKE